MINSNAYEMLIWQKGEVESCIGVSHSRVMEEAVMSRSASLIVERSEEHTSELQSPA